MDGRLFNRWWLMTVLGFGLLHVLLAIVADPYCVYGIVRYPKRNFEPNTRFLKVEYLRRHPEYDAFILGSSRAGIYDTAAAARHCGSVNRYYNLSASLENGAGIRRKIEWLLGTRRVRRIIVNVDFDLQSVGNDPYDLLRQDHPDVSRTPYTSFFAKYLLFQPRIVFRYIKANLDPSKGAPWNDGNSAAGEPLYATAPLFDPARLYAVTVGAINHDLAMARSDSAAPGAAGMAEFRRTVDLLHQAGVDHVLIVPPYRLDQFASFHPDAFAEWLRQLVATGHSVWDFAGYNAVTADPSRYVDPIHFDHATGEHILQRICGAGEVGDDFGIRVTADNLDAHIAALRQQHAAAQDAAPRIRWDSP